MRIPTGTVMPARALVFDMDGTLIDSSVLISTLWRKWAERNGADPVAVVRASAGRRASEIVRMFAPEIDAGAEVAQLFADAAEATDGLVATPGATALLRSLPAQSWAVVTSAERDLAERWFRHTGLPLPAVMVTADDVTHGKPDPEGYLLASRRLGCRPDEMIVFEDSPAGLSAATAAGARAIAVIADRGGMLDRHDWIVDFTGLSLDAEVGCLRFQRAV
jgi:sugar-phosphatase